MTVDVAEAEITVDVIGALEELGELDELAEVDVGIVDVDVLVEVEVGTVDVVEVTTVEEVLLEDIATEDDFGVDTALLGT
jgi:hypothetical protein